MSINKLIICFWIVFITIPMTSSSQCRLPISDGGPEGYTPSPENLFGDIVRVELPLVTIKNGKTGKHELVSVHHIQNIYSVYGGEASLSELKPGLQVWIWFEKCKRPAEGIPFVAYFQIFSTDPNDRAKINRQGKIISVPDL